MITSLSYLLIGVVTCFITVISVKSFYRGTNNNTFFQPFHIEDSCSDTGHFGSPESIHSRRVTKISPYELKIYFVNKLVAQNIMAR